MLFFLFGGVSIICFLTAFILNHSPHQHLSSVRSSAVPKEKSRTFSFAVKRKAGVNKIMLELKKRGYHATVQKTQIRVKIGKGFIAARDIAAAVAKQVAQIVASSSHLAVHTSQAPGGRIQVQVGPICQTKQGAEMIVEKLKKHGYNWKVVPSERTRYESGYEISVHNLSSGQIASLKHFLEDQNQGGNHGNN
jgi:hypothetical protein